MISPRKIWRCAAALTVLAVISLSSRSIAQEQTLPISVISLTWRPQVYTEQKLADLLGQKLTSEEMALVKNPLASTPEMNAWARQITAGTTNEMQKAKLLFDELIGRANPGLGGTRTAQEVFAAWKSPGASFCCEEYASLYVALARAAALQSFLVYVVELYDGGTPRHACAAVYTGDEVLLVDPALRLFGVPHRGVVIMDDVQAIASYMVLAPSIGRHRIAYKLAPDLSVVESNFYLSLMSESQWDEARNVLDAMPRWHTEAWVTNMAQARWALHEGKPAAAAALLQQTIQLNPDVGVCRRMLGDALFQQGKLHEARKVFHDSLPYLFDDFNIASVRQSIFKIDETLADQAATSARSDSKSRVAIEKDDPTIKIEVDQDESGANAGDVFSMMLLARRYERGNGVEQDRTQALKWYQMAARAGNADAMEYLGAIYFCGQGVEKDFSQALVWFPKAAEAGNADAMCFLGKMFLEGDAVVKDDARAFEWYQRGANAGSLAAMSSLGWMYLQGVGVKKNYLKALAWLRKAAEAGNRDAMDNLASMYYFGEGMEKDSAQAAVWFRKAAEAGNSDAMNSLGVMYEHGEGVPKARDEAVRWYKKAAEGGNAEAMKCLGVMCLNGAKEDSDYTQAAGWYRKAALVGNSEAMQYLGSMYYHGQGVSQDLAQAATWIRKAADAGNPESMNDLGGMYSSGNGVAEDDAQALVWFRKSAEAGNPTAMFNIGTTYESGQGTIKDQAEAIRWYRMAAKAGSAEAAKRLGSLTNIVNTTTLPQAH
jgi:hypothetical protein